MNKYFDHQGPRAIRMLRFMTVSAFEDLGIKTWKGIDQRWVYFEQVLKLQCLTNIINGVLACKDITRYESGYKWGLRKPEYVCK